MPNNKIVVTKEQIQKAMACETLRDRRGAYGAGESGRY